MLNPTCPQCPLPLSTRDAMLVMSQVAIWLQCENGHDTVEIVPVSRFNPGLSAKGYDELVQENEMAWQAFLAIARGDLTDLYTSEFFNWARHNDIANEYYNAWQEL